MRSYFASALSAFTLLAITSVASAQLIYSFEGGTDGFAPNGGGIAVASSAIGATVGAGSMRNSSLAGATFTGALSTSIPAALDPNNPNIQSVDFDLTVNQGETFTGAFANIGITLFGHGDPDGIPGNGDELFGLQFQVRSASERNIALAPGTYSLNIPLIGTNPMTFATDQTFGQVFGPGPNKMFAVSGFQFFYSKSNDSAATVYIDNVRLVVPEPASIGASAMIGSLALVRRRRAA